MASVKYEYFKNRVENQKRPDVTFLIKSIDRSKIKDWNADEKRDLIEHLDSITKRCESFIGELKKVAEEEVTNEQ